MSDVYVGGFRTQTTGEQTVATYLWDTGSLAWVPQTASTGTGGAVNVTNTFVPVQQYGTWNTNSTITGSLPTGSNFIGNVSITSMPAISVGSVTVSNFPSTQAVTGAFYQATQPVSIAATVSTTDTHTTAAAPLSVRLSDGTSFYTATGGGGGGGNAAASATGAAVPTSADYSGWNNAGNLVGTSLTSALPIQPGTGAVFPVTGSFYQATQPVSISSMPSTPVTGTFWQTTQPVSIATMPTTPVTGTFWQATQPVSVAALPALATGANTIGAVNVNGTVPVSIASLPSGPVTNAGTFAVQVTSAPTTAVTGTFWQATQPVSGTVTITPPAITKGTQGATGLTVQELKDAGRNARIFMLDTYTAAPVAEALASVVQWYSNGAVATTTTPAVVPAGKTLRLSSWKIMYQSLATTGYAVVRIRVNTAGVAALASPLVYSFEAGSAAAVAGVVQTETGDFPEGFEIPAAAGIGFTIAGYGPAGVLTLEGGVRFTVTGYEY